MSNLSKSSILNQRAILGKEIHEVNWKEGVGEFAVRFDNFSAIPWILPHWYGEKNKRVTEVKDWATSHSFMNRALSIIKQDKQSIKASDRTTGEELLKLLELQNTKLTKSLNHDPLNSNLRTQLVSKTLERLSKKTSISLKQYRTLFLQAITANSCGEVSTESLMLLKKIQDLYYRQAHKVCEDRALNYQPNSNDSPEVKLEKEKIVSTSTAHMNIITSEKKYLNNKLRRILATSQSKTFKLSINDFKEWNPDEKNAEEIKRKLIAHAWEAIQFMRCFPLLHEEANIFADHVKMIDSQNPLGIFLKGYIAVAKADLLIMAYRRGVKSSKRLDIIYSLLKTAIKYYEHSASFINGNYNVSNTNILSEYANALLFLHNLGKLGKIISYPILDKHVKNISHLLNHAAKRSQSKVIQQTIQKVELITHESEAAVYC